MPRIYNKYASGQMIFYPGNTGPGNEYFVDSTNGSASNSGKDWENAMLTINQANDKCTASNGDTIYVAPFHAENIVADSGVNLDLAGVQVVGVTRGREMPEITFTTLVTADFKLAAAGVSIHNLRFKSGINALAGPIEVSAADCAIVNCEFMETSPYECVDTIITTAAADRLLIDGYTHFGAATAGANSAIALIGADDCEIRNCKIYGNFAVGGIDMRTTVSLRTWIHHSYLWMVNAADIAIVDTVTASSGAIGPEINIRLADDAANIVTAVTAATHHMFNPVRVVNAVDEVNLSIDGGTGYWTASTNGA